MRLPHFVRTRHRRTFTYCKPLVVTPGKPPVELNRLDTKNWTPTPAVVDWKGSLDQRVQYQVAGYSLALAESGTQITHGFGVELRNDGSFKMSSVYDLMRGRQQFLALLSVYNMRRDAGIPVEGAV